MEQPHEYWFDHEKLEVYQEAIRFAGWATDLIESITGATKTRDQLDRSATSVPLNIAEGNGKQTGKDRCQYFDIACGSALESAAALDVLVAKRKVTAQRVCGGKESLQRTVKMLVGLRRANADRA